MEKNGDLPPPYQGQGYGYDHPQNPPSYNQAPPPAHGQAPPPGPHTGYPQQPFMQPGQAPPQGYQYQQYPNVVVQQPIAFAGPPRGPPPPDHMTAAIFVTLCCFWPTGIIAIIKANDAKNAWMRGDAVMANTNARSAKNMVTVSIVAGICSIIVAAVIIGLYWGLFLSQYNDDDYYD